MANSGRRGHHLDYGLVTRFHAAIIASMPEGNSPVRVLQVIARMNLGGPAHYVALLSARLDRRRYETLLVSGRVGPGEEEHTDLDGVDIRYIKPFGPEIRPLQDILALIALIRLIRAFRPTIDRALGVFDRQVFC